MTDNTNDLLAHAEAYAENLTVKTQGEAAVADILDHSGIKGMRWGVRNSRGGYVGSGRKKGDNKSAPPKHEQKHDNKFKPRAKPMSDEELKKKVERMKLDRKLSELSQPELSGGRKFLNEVMKELGKEYIKTGVKTGVGAVAGPVGVAGAAAASGLSSHRRAKRSTQRVPRALNP